MQTPPSTPRKTDRRTLYTVGVIKDALLELLEQDSFDKITVASLCRQAEITRATFYLHFPSLDDVLNEVLDDALMVAEAAASEMTTAERMQALEQLVKSGTPEDLRRNERLLSPCQRVADNPKYRAIFQDETLSGYVIQRIYKMEREEHIAYMSSRVGLSRRSLWRKSSGVPVRISFSSAFMRSAVVISPAAASATMSASSSTSLSTSSRLGK